MVCAFREGSLVHDLQVRKLKEATSVGQSGGRIGQSDKFSGRIIFLAEKCIWLRVDDSQHFTTANAAHEQAVAMHGNHPIFFVKDRLLGGVSHCIV